LNTPFPTQTRADPCTSPLTLYRANVALPDSMGQPRQERIVFFEVPTQQAGTFKVFSHLENLLATAWSVSTEDWVERGLIYNTWSEQDLFDSSAGEGDSRLFETAWGVPKGIYYANAADVDLFVTPRTRARLDKAMEAITNAPKSVAAKHLLRRMQQDGRLAYLMDPLTTSYELLTAEVAAATGQDVESFRKAFEATLKYTPVSRG
jgi:hypothetical protein